ncbi:hypothetical protein S2091_0057 [Solimicrobium silvestre]|uniref:DUF937 domain-containing protein n=2 Tax=Solimicrobium silvestre TaxID=2099400 RepID=A0A2S9H4F1_9BURK|nr:hypothetical protein S2091_0057 [Solimicrobium silvestre]
MGLLDAALGMLSGNNATDPKMAVMQAAIGLLSNHEGGASAGVQELMSTLQNAGLSEHVASWIGEGQNLPVSGEQIQQALEPSGVLQQLAETAGLSHEEVASHLAAMLPGVIEKFSQNDGQIGGLGNIAGMLSQFMSSK